MQFRSEAGIVWLFSFSPTVQIKVGEMNLFRPSGTLFSARGTDGTAHVTGADFLGWGHNCLSAQE